MLELDPSDPRQVGPYRLVGRIGVGGMGTQYLGLSAAGRAVAIKMIHAELARDPSFLARFRTEVEAARAVSGIYTAPVVAAGTDVSPPWMATAFISGPSLSEAVRELGPLPETAIWRLAGGLVEALQDIHSSGLVHRDLKPANILLAADGPRVIDFGISRAWQDAGTTTGNLVGTPAYMSPEQAAGERIGPQSDIFSLGCVIAFAATGISIFYHERIYTTIWAIINSEPDLSAIPDPVRALVSRCLAKNPAERPSLSELLEEISARSDSHPASSLAFWPRPLSDLIRSRDENIFQPAEPGPPDASEPSASSDPPAEPSPSYQGQADDHTAPPGGALSLLEGVLVPPGHVFISYAREDSEFADDLQRRLEAAGVPVWRDTARLWPGEDWREKIRQAIVRDALVFLACFSTQGQRRQPRYQNEELNLAIEQMRERSPEVPWLIPVRFDDCDIPDRDIGGGRRLASIQRSDFFGQDLDYNATRLVKAVLRILGPSGKPAWTSMIEYQPPAHLNLTGFLAFSADIVASQLADLSENEAALLLATAPVEVSADVLEVLLDRDQARAVSLLTRLNRRKAKDLISAIPSKPAWLEELPEAVEAIARCYSRARDALGLGVGRVYCAGPSPAGTRGFSQNFEYGQVSWTAGGGAHLVSGDIGDYYRRLGGSNGSLGFPATDEIRRESSRHTKGSSQGFQFSGDYPDSVCSQLGLSFGGNVYSSQYGTYATSGEIGEYYESHGGPSSRLGFPISDEDRAQHSKETDTGAVETGTRQIFEGGITYLIPKRPVLEVSARIAEVHDNLGGTAGPLGFPVGEESVLAGQENGILQEFEGGIIYEKHPFGIIAVTDLVAKVLGQDSSFQSKLGFPTEPEVRLPDTHHVIQFFEHGVVTVTKGLPAIWLRHWEAPLGQARSVGDS